MLLTTQYLHSIINEYIKRLLKEDTSDDGMCTVKDYIPNAETERLNKWLKKCAQKIPMLQWEFSEPYKKAFNHTQIAPDGVHANAVSVVKMLHTVRDLTITYPKTLGDWELVSTIKNGNEVPADYSQELHYQNPKHGIDYDRCDACGHHVEKAFFVIRNIKDGREEQVGSSCAKKYGLGGFIALSQFQSELNEVFDFGGGFDDPDDDPLWRFGKDDTSRHAIKTINAIAAAKIVYDQDNGVYKNGRVTTTEIERVLCDAMGGKVELDTNYGEAVQKFIAESEYNEYSTFETDMHSAIKNFYIDQYSFHYAFFAVKSYELEKQKREREAQGFKKLPIGSQIHVVGTIVDMRQKDGWYGPYTEYIIKTDDGYTLKREGATPYDEATKRINAYAIIKDYWDKGDIYTLARITKAKKKGIPVVNEQ